MARQKRNNLSPAFVSVEPLHSFDYPAGDVWVGDPCYLLCLDPFWKEFCHALEPWHSNKEHPVTSGIILKFQLDGKEESIFVCGMAHGDGLYEVKEGEKRVGEAGVDAGMLSVIPLPIAKRLDEIKEGLGLGVIAKCDGGDVVAEDGSFECANINVKTDEDDKEDEEDDEDDFEDDEEDFDEDDEDDEYPDYDEDEDLGSL